MTNYLFIKETSTGTTTVGDLIYHNGSMVWVSGSANELWFASDYNSYVKNDHSVLLHGKEYTCEFCSRANPIANLECERCGAPREAV